MIDRVSEELWMEVSDIVQEVVIKTNPRKRNARRLRVVSEGLTKN